MYSSTLVSHHSKEEEREEGGPGRLKVVFNTCTDNVPCSKEEKKKEGGQLFSVAQTRRGGKGSVVSSKLVPSISVSYSSQLPSIS